MTARMARVAFVASLSLSALAVVSLPAAAEIHLAVEVVSAESDAEFPEFLLAGQRLVVRVTVSQDGHEVRLGQTAVYGGVDPDRELTFSESSPGTFASEPIAFETLGSFFARVEAHLVDLPPNASPKLVENTRKMREQIAAFEAKIAALESQSGDHEKAIEALRAALQNRRAALRKLLAMLGGFAETTVEFVVHPVPVIVSGDAQTGGPGDVLPLPLGVALRRVDRTTPLENAGVRFDWEPEAGVLESSMTFTSAEGITVNRFRLPPAEGVVRVEAAVIVAGVSGPAVVFEATVVEDIPIEIPEPKFVLSMPGDGRTAVRQSAIPGRGKGLLPLIVRVGMAEAPANPVPMMPIAFEVIEGEGLFVNPPEYSIYSNRAGEAGILFIPTAPIATTVRASIFRRDFGGAAPVFFHFDPAPPRIEDAGEEPLPALPGNALDRPFRVRVTGPDGAPLAGEIVEFRLGEDFSSETGSFTSTTAKTDEEGYAESVFLVAASAIEPLAPVPLTVPVEIHLPEFEDDQGEPIHLDKSITIETAAQREARGQPVYEEVVSGNGTVGHESFFTKDPFVVRSVAHPGFQIMNFAVISGGGKLKPAIGSIAPIDPEIVKMKFPGYDVSDVLSLYLEGGQAAVTCELADDDTPVIIAASLQVTVALATVYGAVSPPDVRIVDMEGRPLASLAPADLRSVSPETQGFLLEARLPVGFDLPIEGKLVTRTRAGQFASDFDAAAAPVSIEDIELAPLPEQPDPLATIWRSASTSPFIPTVETFPDPREKPIVSGSFRPLQLPDHGWVVPKAVLADESANDDGSADSLSSRGMVKARYFFVGASPTETVPPATKPLVEGAVPPILTKQGVPRGSAPGTPEVPIVYQLVIPAPWNANSYQWTFHSPEGRKIERTSLSGNPEVFVWFQDGKDDLSRDGASPNTPWILGVSEKDVRNRRGNWRISVQPFRQTLGSLDFVGQPVPFTLYVATRKSFDLGPTHIPLTSEGLNDRFPEFVAHEAFFTAPPTDTGDINGKRFDSILTQFGVGGLAGYMALPADQRFAGHRRLLWFETTQSPPTVGATFGPVSSPEEIRRMIEATGREDPPVRFEQLRLYGVGLDKTHSERFDNADLAQVVLHEWTHVLEKSAFYLWDITGLEPKETRLTPAYHGELLGRSVEAFRRRRQLHGDKTGNLLVYYIQFLPKQTEVGAYFEEMRRFDPRGTDPGSLGSYHLYDNSSTNFITSYHDAVLASFVPRSPGGIVPAWEAGSDIKRWTLQWFQDVFAEVVGQMPWLYGGWLEMGTGKFEVKIKNVGSDAANPYAIYTPFD